MDIPIKIKQCKFGPGGIIIAADNKEEAQKTLHDCCRELQILIKAKEDILTNFVQMMCKNFVCYQSL